MDGADALADALAASVSALPLRLNSSAITVWRMRRRTLVSNCRTAAASISAIDERYESDMEFDIELEPEVT